MLLPIMAWLFVAWTRVAALIRRTQENASVGLRKEKGCRIWRASWVPRDCECLQIQSAEIQIGRQRSAGLRTQFVNLRRLRRLREWRFGLKRMVILPVPVKRLSSSRDLPPPKLEQ